jgi:hypothetical protein
MLLGNPEGKNKNAREMLMYDASSSTADWRSRPAYIKKENADPMQCTLERSHKITKKKKKKRNARC